MFITDDDYSILIQDDILLRIIEDNPDIRIEAELFAQKTVEAYLRSKYDVVAIFEKTGEDRDRDVLIYTLDIAIHLLHSRINPDQIPQIRIDRYNAAMTWLNKIAKQDISPNLPTLPTEEQKNSISVKSEPKQKFDF